MTPYLLAAAIISAGPTLGEQAVCSDTVDLIEVNHVYNECGKHNFDQIIFFDWSPGEGRFRVRAWRILKPEAQRPYRDWRLDRYTVVWNDGDAFRTVHSPSLRESWTQHDPELADRRCASQYDRAGLAHEAVQPRR